MHRIQLSFSDLLKESNFINEAVETICAVSSQFKVGQAYEHLRETSVMLDIFLVPMIFKTMKLLAYSESVLVMNLNNYKLNVGCPE